ncbi:unnamed protein product [Arctogadus glacialis]
MLVYRLLYQVTSPPPSVSPQCPLQAYNHTAPADYTSAGACSSSTVIQAFSRQLEHRVAVLCQGNVCQTASCLVRCVDSEA